MSESLFSYLILGDSYFILEMSVGGASTSYDVMRITPPHTTASSMNTIFT